MVALRAPPAIAMPWTVENPPTSMRHLPTVVLIKAVAIANALLEHGHDEGQSIRIAIAQAKAWAARRGYPVE